MAETSPRLKNMDAQPLCGFYEVLKEIRLGSKATRVIWQDSNVYGFMNDGKLSIRLVDKKTHDWIIHETDMDATDWIVLGE